MNGEELRYHACKATNDSFPLDGIPVAVDMPTSMYYMMLCDVTNS